MAKESENISRRGREVRMMWREYFSFPSSLVSVSSFLKKISQERKKPVYANQELWNIHHFMPFLSTVLSTGFAVWI